MLIGRAYIVTPGNVVRVRVCCLLSYFYPRDKLWFDLRHASELVANCCLEESLLLIHEVPVLR